MTIIIKCTCGTVNHVERFNHEDLKCYKCGRILTHDYKYYLERVKKYLPETVENTL